MAQRFFNQKVAKSKNSSNKTFIISSIIGVIIVIAIGVGLAYYNKDKNKDVVVEVRDGVAVEVNSKLPDKTLFFKELQNVKEKNIKADYNNVKIGKVGSYDVALKVLSKKYSSKLDVVDTKAPQLTLKDAQIKSGESYTANDFVESCTDNSKEKCKVSFYNLSLSQTGQKIDYSKYTEDGTYVVQIVASDASGNSTSPQSVKLIIGSGESKNNTVCEYGNDVYDSSTYLLAVNVTENGCALDLNVYDNETTVAPVNRIIENETAKLKKEFTKVNLGTQNIYLNSNIGPVLNTAGTGIVGYTLYMEVSIIDSNNQKEIIESYTVDINGQRVYKINKYL